MKWRRASAWAAAAFTAWVAAGCVSQGDTVSKAQFVGSEACAGCHRQAYDTWKQTVHARMVLPRQEGLLKEPAEKWASDGKNAGPTKGNIDGKPYKLDDVVYVIGTKWKQRYLVKNEATGNHQFLDKQWNLYTRQWEPYGQKNDWETQCTTCHTTGYKVLAKNEKGAVTRHSFSERNIGCEACHGPGSAHAASGNKAHIFNPKNVSAQEASKVCGYCHIRLENDYYLTGQGNHSEFLPHPVIGESYKAGQDDWTRWYPDKALIPGVHAEDALTAENKGTDLANAFFLDAQSQQSGLYDARKHHQQYQEYVQSKHFKSGVVGCSTCHSAHGGPGKTVRDAKASCANCHGDRYDWQKVMPGTGQTAGQLFMRTHTFNPNQARSTSAMTAERLPPAEFYYKK